MTKLIIDPATERVLGVGIVGHGAGELIAEGVLAVEMGATAKDLSLCVHPHPTLSETLMESAEVFYGHATHVFARKNSGTSFATKRPGRTRRSLVIAENLPVTAPRCSRAVGRFRGTAAWLPVDFRGRRAPVDASRESPQAHRVASPECHRLTGEPRGFREIPGILPMAIQVFSPDYKALTKIPLFFKSRSGEYALRRVG